MSCWLVSNILLLNNTKRAEQGGDGDLGVSGGGDVVEMSVHVFMA